MKITEETSLETRKIIARDPNTPINILVQLSQDWSSDVRYRVAVNPKWTEPENQERIKELEEVMDLEEELGVELF